MPSIIPGTLRGSPFEEEWNWSRQVIESLSLGVSICDPGQPDLPLVYVNAAFERLTGYSRQEILGRNCRFLQGIDTEQSGLDTLRRAIRECTDVRTVLKNYRKDGTVFWNELYLSPIRDSGGRLIQYLGIQNDVTARIELEEKLAFIAQHDVLTGLANRAMLMERLEGALLRASRTKRMVAVLFFDLDNFKFVNDTFGHDEGDTLLQVVADRMLACTRAYETAARIGGDEFVMVLESIEDEHEAAAAMQRITREITQPIAIGERPFLPSVSVGLALSPCDGSTARDLLHVADTAMYVAKHLRKHNREASPLKGLGQAGL